MLKWISILLLTAVGSLGAATISLTGSFDPQEPNEIFEYSFTTTTAGAFIAQSFGFGGGTNSAGAVIPSGGFDTYFSLFTGQGPGALFLLSNDDGSCPPGNDAEGCRDSGIDLPNLAAGEYTLVLSVFSNFSFAENLGSGTLGDGFIGLGNYFDVSSGTDRTSNWAFDITGEFPQTAIPEPASLGLVAGSILLVAIRRYTQLKASR